MMHRRAIVLSLVVAICSAAPLAHASVPLWSSKDDSISLEMGLLLNVTLVPYAGENSDPYNFDPLYSEGFKINTVAARFLGKLPYHLHYGLEVGMHGGHLSVHEAVVAFEPWDFLKLRAGKLLNPTFHNLRIQDENLGIPARPIVMDITQPRQVTGFTLYGTLFNVVSYWLGFYPTDTKFRDRTFGGSASIHPLGPVAEKETGFYPGEDGYDKFRFAIGAGVLDTWYEKAEDTYRRWGFDLVMQYRMIALTGGWFRYRSNTSTVSCGEETYETKLNQGFYVQASGFVLPGTLCLLCRYERNYLDAPMTDWAAELEDVITCSLAVHLKRGLVTLWAGFTHRRDDLGLDNDHAFAAIQIVI